MGRGRVEEVNARVLAEEIRYGEDGLGYFGPVIEGL